jgi:hypothetical protein
MIHHLSPLAGFEPGTSSFTRVSPYSSLPQEAIPQVTCTHNFQKSKHTLHRSLTPLMEGQKVNFLAEIFMVNAKILYVLVVRISDFFDFFGNLCAISKAAFVVFVWLISKA